MEPANIIAGVAALVAGVTLFRNQTVSKLAADQSGRLLALEKVMEMVVKNLTVSFVVEKHRPHPEFKEQDALIEKFANDSITSGEQADFLRMVQTDAANKDGEISDRLIAGAILEMWRARDIIHESSPAFTQLTGSERMLSTMKTLNADTKDWLEHKISRDKAAIEAEKAKDTQPLKENQ